MPLNVHKTIRVTQAELDSMDAVWLRYHDRQRPDLYARWLKRHYGHTAYNVGRYPVQGKYELALGTTDR